MTSSNFEQFIHVRNLGFPLTYHKKDIVLLSTDSFDQCFLMIRFIFDVKLLKILIPL
jgi:hypothetical protein